MRAASGFGAKMDDKHKASRSSGVHCSVHGCQYNQRKLNLFLEQPCFDHKPLRRQDCSCDPPYRMHRMPDHDPELRRQWLAALNRKNPPRNVFVCSYHFVDRKPTKENPIPELNLGYQKRMVQKRRVIVRSSPDMRSDNGASELAFHGTRKRKSSSVPAAADISPRKQLKEDVCQPSDDEESGVLETPASPTDLLSATASASTCTCTSSGASAAVTQMDASTQWTDIHLEHHDYSTPWMEIHKQEMQMTGKDAGQVKTRSQGQQCQISDDLGVADTLLRMDSDAKLYTGIPLVAFTMLVNCLRPYADKKFRMHVADQILMTLMKLRLNLLYADLARRFSVSESLVSKTVSFWIDTMAVRLHKLVMWLPREAIRATTPKCFKHYPKTTCILDCAESIMQKASNLRSRGESYSNYKSHNTVKYCVAIAPCGYIMHISKAYGGRASDKFIVQDSGLLNRLVPGDEVMADRGFTIQDLLFPLRVSLNIPAFSHGRQLPAQEVTRTRRIARVRIHVERAIRRLKVFRILKETVPVSMTKKIDKILRICAALVNLGNDLIKDKVAAED